MTDFLGYAYAAIVTVGGVIGYVKKGSAVSLAAGVIFGAAAGYGASLTSKDAQNVFVILGASALMTGAMGYRYFNTGKFMPAGLVAALSLFMAVRYGYRLVSK